MFGMGAGEIVVIAIVALLVLGPNKLPEAAKALGKGIRAIRSQTREFQETVEKDSELGSTVRELKSALRGDEPPAAPPPAPRPPPPQAIAQGAPVVAGEPPSPVPGAPTAPAVADATPAAPGTPAAPVAGPADPVKPTDGNG